MKICPSEKYPLFCLNLFELFFLMLTCVPPRRPQDSFSQLLYMYLSEGVPVRNAHSASRRAGLHAAAARGLTETAQQMLQLGKLPSIQDLT